MKRDVKNLRLAGFVWFCCFALTSMAQKPEPLTLDQAIDFALKHNPEVSATQWKTAARVAGRDAVKAQRLPAVKLLGAYDYQSEASRLYPATYNGEPGVFGQGIAGGEVVLSIPLYTGGRISSEIAASELLRQASEGELSRTREVVVFNVTSLFYSILAQQEVIESVESAVRAIKEHRRSVEELVAAQKAARVDVLRAEVRQAALEETRTRELNTLSVQRWALAALIGLDSNTAPEIDGSLELENPPECPESALCLNKALAYRPDYISVQQQTEAQAQAIQSARSGYLPTVSLRAGYGMRWMDDVEDQPAGTDRSQDVGHVGLVAEWSLFSGGSTRANVRQQAALYQASQDLVRQMQLQIRTEVESALSGIAAARVRVATSSKSVEQARESFRIMREKYDLGKGAMTDVLDAQASLVFAETSLARARADLAISEAQKKLATGTILR
ncbi:TolC family protein [Pontiellaceae bacterium B12219]|nr:TolC family protein [Pontiellaceae bacterium B12219]